MTLPNLGVAIVSFNSGSVILDCLESLLASQNVRLNIVVVDNKSSDDTVAMLRSWADGSAPYRNPGDLPFDLQTAAKPLPLDGQATGEIGHRVQLIEAEINGGFAAGVNLGLAALAEDETLDRFWILNPDSAVPATTAAAFATSPAPDFSMIGGRVLYLDDPDRIQIDGGTINKKTGVTNNINQGQSHADTPSPKVADMDFITGASMVVSRGFYEAAGPMPESYFLYYEEVDWALKRGDMPMYYCPEGVVYHRAGTSIGSVTPWRPAAPFSQYFLHRNRVRFVRKFFPKSVTVALGFSVAKAAKLLLKGYPVEAFTILSASFGGKPSAKIRARVAEAAQDLAFK